MLGLCNSLEMPLRAAESERGRLVESVLAPRDIPGHAWRSGALPASLKALLELVRDLPGKK